MKGISCAQRLNRDVAELFSSDFNCSASYLTVFQSGDSLNELGSINLESKVFEGPYRGGRFNFCFHIPANYPFKPVEVWATHPIWHPNIDLRTGKVAVPLEWSPVLTLHAFALAVQMLMLEPSSENPLNLESYSSYLSQPQLFDQQVQLTLRGGWFSGVHFPASLLSLNEMAVRSTPTKVKRLHDEEEDEPRKSANVRNSSSKFEEGSAMTSSSTSQRKRSRRRYSIAEEAEEEEEEEVEEEGAEEIQRPFIKKVRYDVISPLSNVSMASQLSASQISLAYSRLSLSKQVSLANVMTMDVASPSPYH